MDAESCGATPNSLCGAQDNVLVAMRLGETPVHIPNTMVKPYAADDTMLETVWESRWLPDLLKEKSTILIKCLTGD